MTNCKYLTKNGRCGLKGSYAYRHGCFGEDMCRCREPMTNADRIRAMSDEELLGCLLELQDMAIKRFANFEPPDYQWMADWLQQSAEEDGHDERKENANARR